MRGGTSSLGGWEVREEETRRGSFEALGTPFGKVFESPLKA